ncbi:acid-sensing ion channel 4-B-like [Haliotis asinina]|uniref:acid-sensing ion channel 4-B-like n=1 Tax=Haliotis asinina TaxID=109174 RepID=UPI00353258D7
MSGLCHNVKGRRFKVAIENNSSRTEHQQNHQDLVECCCSDAWVDFTQTTSLQGLRYIWMRETIPVRRLLWLLLTVTCVAVMSYQIVERVIYFYNHPVTVNVKVKYNKTLFFPTITICNQNTFRASKAAELGYYEFLTDMFTGGRRMSVLDLESRNATNITLRHLYASTAHTMEDMIVSCQWRGEPCGIFNFTEIMTDHGVCFSFNLPDPNTSVSERLHVTDAGAENGLSLTLNVEQYEYMPGPHDAAGVKILIHDHQQFPKVQELGIALPTGTHSFVGMQLISINNLPKPHGECQCPNLKYFPHYSIETCQVECSMLNIYHRCGCRLFYMPETEDDIPLCTLRDYYSCYKPFAVEIRESVQQNCHCPIPCNYTLFDATVSYATTSTFVIDRFLSNTNRSALKMKYQNARDITHRLQINKAQELRTLLQTLDQNFEMLRHVIFDLKGKINEQRMQLINISADFLWNWNETDMYFQYQNYIHLKDLARARDAMNERTYSVIAHGVQEFTFSVERKIEQLVDAEINETSVRKMLFIMVKNQLEARIDMAKRTIQNHTQLLSSYLNGTPVFNYRFRKFNRKYSYLLIPKELIHRAFHRSDIVRRHTSQLESDIKDMIYWMEEYENLAMSAFMNGSINDTLLYFTNIHFLDKCRQFLQSKSHFFNDFIEWMVIQLNKRERDFFHIKKDFRKARDVTSKYLGVVRDAMENILVSLEDLEKGKRVCEDYLNYGNISLEVAAHFFRSKAFQNNVNNLNVFFATVRNRGQNVYDSWDKLSVVSQEMWNFTLMQVDLMPYWRYMNISRYLRNSSEVIREIKDSFVDHRDIIDVQRGFDNKDETFLQSLHSLSDLLDEFHASSHVDSAFVKENFLKLEVYFRQLSYEQHTQQIAYDVFALLCDIGGSMGLFIGASVLTIVEILDLIMFQALRLSNKG